MSAWHKLENVFRQLNRLLDTPVPTLADSPGVDLPCEWMNRTVDMLVIDVSPSMDITDYEPSRLGGAVQAATRFIRRRAETEPDSLLGVITFSKDARVIVPPCPVKAALEEATNALQGISTSSCTNIAAGLARAQEQITRIAGARDPRILLLTDGHSNTGDDPRDIAANLKEQGTQLSIIGIGGVPTDVDEAMLKEMASIIDDERRYWFIKSIGELVQKFEALSLREF